MTFLDSLHTAHAQRNANAARGFGDPEIQAMNAAAPLLDLIQRDTGEQGHDCGDYVKFDRCPVCGHSDCMRYYHSTNSWTCFGASNTTGKRGGGYSDYLAAAHRMTAAEAVAELRRVTGNPRTVRQKVDNAFKHDPRQKQRAFDHASMGDRLIEEFNVGTVDGIPVIWDADAMRYRAGREAIEKKMVELRRGIRRNQRAEVIAYLDLQAPEHTMADPRFIAFENGILDISTMGLSEPSQDTIIANVIPHRWNPNAVCPELDEAISAWACGNTARTTNIRETIGLCMYRDRHMAQSPVLIGRGANGKSTFLNFLREVIGRENVSGLNLSAIGKRFQSIALMGKLANICDDLSNAFVAGELMEDAKKALSGDGINAEYKGGKTFSYRPYAQFVFSCNAMPRLGDTSFGSYRRFVPIMFEAVFSAKDGTANISQEKVLSTEAAYERAIVLGIEALRGCIERGGMTPTEEAAEAIEDMRRQNSSVVSWVADTMWSAEELIGMQTADAYGKYSDYCATAGMRCVNRNTFTAEITATYGIDTARPRSHGQKSTFVRRG